MQYGYMEVRPTVGVHGVLDQQRAGRHAGRRGWLERSSERGGCTGGLLQPAVWRALLDSGPGTGDYGGMAIGRVAEAWGARHASTLLGTMLALIRDAACI